MKQNPAHIGLATNDERRVEERAVKLRRDLEELFLAALGDPGTVGIILSTDGALWQERARDTARWRPVGTMAASRAELVTRTVASCMPTTLPLKEFRLDCPVTAIPVNLVWQQDSRRWCASAADPSPCQRRQPLYSDFAGARLRY
jgi:hypothetical protein